tara:strand:+ start:103 stop:528 length:426 start_codon:yes stop_codon:yes gene_type:complete
VRPHYEKADDRRREAAVAKEFSRWLDLSATCEREPEFSELDWRIGDHFAEIKCRRWGMGTTKYPSLMIDKSKVEAAAQKSNAVYIIIGLFDGIWHSTLHPVPSGTEYRISGRRSRGPEGRKECAFIPLHHFRKVSDMVVRW